ncbi:MAG: SLC13 family permease, partial [Chloroflexi bacterium]
MTPEMWVTLLIFGVAIILFITEWVRVDIVALGVVIALVITGILDAKTAFSGFSSTSVLAIAALFVVGGAVLQTGLASAMANRILRIAGHDEPRLIVFVMIAVALMSGIMSDTGAVAVMLPAVVSLANSVNIPPSRLLIPLAFGSLFGGSSTLIGTPPNIIVSELLQKNGYAPFQLFDFTPIGVLLMAVGALFLLTIGRRLLPARRKEQLEQQVATPAELIQLYSLPDNLFRLRVRSRSSLIGKTLGECDLRSEYGINVLEVSRPAQPRVVAKIGDQRLMLQGSEPKLIHPENDLTLQRDDVLICQGDPEEVGRASVAWNLAIQPATPDDHEALVTDEVGVVELLLPPRSELIGQTVQDVRFGTTYHLTVLAIRRPGVDEPLDVKTTRLQSGDTLLVQGRWKDIANLRRHRRDFVVLGATEHLNGNIRRGKAPIAAAVLVGMLALIVFDVVPITVAAFMAALAMVLTGCLTMDEAYNSIDWKSLVLIAGTLPMSAALTEVGLVDLMANTMVDVLGGLGPYAVLGGLFLMTALLTQVLSNTTTAVLLAPVGFAASQTLGVSPYPFLIAIAFAASF